MLALGVGTTLPALQAGEIPALVAVEPVLEAGAPERPGIRDLAREAGNPARIRLRPLGAQDPRARLLRELGETGPLREIRALIATARRAARAAGRDAPEPRSPIAVALPGSRFTPSGPSYLYAIPSRIEGGAAVPGFVLLAPLASGGRELTVEELHAGGMLPAMLVHELTHLAMAEAYGDRYLELKALADPFARHDAPVRTDPHTALIEGLAEAFEALLEARHPGEVYPEPAVGAPSEVRTLRDRFVRERVENIHEGRYVFRQDGRRRDGELDGAEEGMATEGVVAGLLVAMAPHLGAADGAEALLVALAEERPASFPELVLALVRRLPARGPVLERILLECTRYTTLAPAAHAEYRRAYLARKAFLRGEGSEAAARRARLRWERFRAAQRARVASGTSVLAALPVPFPVDLGEGERFDLNDPDPEVLRAGLEGLGAADPHAAAALVERARARAGVLRDVRQIRGLDPALAARLAAGAREAARQDRARVQAIAARLAEGRRRAAYVDPPDPCRFDSTTPRPAAGRSRKEVLG